MLHPVEHDQVRAIGARLRERRGSSRCALALDWLAATEPAPGIGSGLVVAGDLAEQGARCSDHEGRRERIADLAWASVTAEELMAVRRRVEGW